MQKKERKKGREIFKRNLKEEMRCGTRKLLNSRAWQRLQNRQLCSQPGDNARLCIFMLQVRIVLKKKKKEWLLSLTRTDVSATSVEAINGLKSSLKRST